MESSQNPAVSVGEEKVVSPDYSNGRRLKEESDAKAVADVDVDTDSNEVISSAAEIVTHVIDVEDDPSINPWTFRMIFLGKGTMIFSIKTMRRSYVYLIYL